MPWALVIVVFAGLFAPMMRATSVSVYYNQAAWQAAMSLNGANPLTSVSLDSSQWTSTLEKLPSSSSLVSQSASAASNGLPVTVDSTCGALGVCPTLGSVSNGFWTDSLGKYSSTDFNFGAPIYGFGGYFQIAGSNGLYISGAGEVAGGSTFIGIISDQPMSDVFITWGDSGGCEGCFGNSYTLSNLQVATVPTPEPSFKYPYIGAALLVVCYGVFRRRRGVHS